MAGMFDGWDTGQGGGTGIFPPWLTQLLQQTPPDVLLQGIQALTQAAPQAPPQGDGGALPPNAQPAMLSPSPMAGYEPRKSIFDRPDSIPGDRMDGAPPAMGGGYSPPPMGGMNPAQLPGASAMAQAPQQMAQASPQGMPSMGGGGGFGLMNLLAPKAAARMEAQQQQAQITNMTAQAFMKKGNLDAQTAYAIASDPVMRKEYAQQLFAKPEGPLTVNNKLIDRNTHQVLADFSDPPKEEVLKLSPGEIGFKGGKEIARGAPKMRDPSPHHTWIDPNDPSKGETPIPGGPATKVPAEVAGRLAMMETAQKDLPNAKKILLEGRGATGHTVMGNVQSFLDAGEVGQAKRVVRVGIESALRVMTGAAAPDSEVDRYEKMFMPSPGDSHKTAEQKLGLLEQFMVNAKRTVLQGRDPGTSSGWTDMGGGVRIREKQ
jgi:hypothetical protein